MEARQSFRGSSISKTFVAIVLVIVALGLGVMGAYVAKSLSGSAAAPAISNTDNTTQPAAPQRTRPLHLE